MVSFSSLSLFALAYVTSLINAISLVARDALDVASPPVTYPTRGVRWIVGHTQTVTWDTSQLPAQISNPSATVVLGWLDSSGGYNLQLRSPLASGIPITAGKAVIKVPSYPDRDTYIIAVIGSSGNISPTFTITSGSGIEAGSGSGVANPPATTPTIPAQPSPTSDSGSNAPSTMVVSLLVGSLAALFL